MMIFVLIAGSYTPVCLIVLGGKSGYTLLAASVGHCGGRNADKSALDQLPEVVFFRDLYRNGLGVSVWYSGNLLATPVPGSISVAAAGGLIYTVGGVIYALKLPAVQREAQVSFGSHEVFHLFVMAGSICHFVFMYQYVA